MGEHRLHNYNILGGKLDQFGGVVELFGVEAFGSGTAILCSGTGITTLTFAYSLVHIINVVWPKPQTSYLEPSRSLTTTYKSLRCTLIVKCNMECVHW